MPSGIKNVQSVICLHKEEAFLDNKVLRSECHKQARTPMKVTFEGFPEDFHFHWNSKNFVSDKEG